MPQTINPKTTPRAKAFELWMNSPMPMVTLTKTFDISHLVKLGRKNKLKLNMLLCYCIGKAASIRATSISPTICSNSTAIIWI